MNIKIFFRTSKKAGCNCISIIHSDFTLPGKLPAAMQTAGVGTHLNYWLSFLVGLHVAFCLSQALNDSWRSKPRWHIGPFGDLFAWQQSKAPPWTVKGSRGTLLHVMFVSSVWWCVCVCLCILQYSELEEGRRLLTLSYYFPDQRWHRTVD